MLTSAPLSSSELRQRVGFPANAGRLMLLPLIFAYPSMVLLRHKIGVRMVSFPRLLAAVLLLIFWGLVPSLLLPPFLGVGDPDAYFRPMWCFVMIVWSVGLAHRMMRWQRRLRGERLHTLAMGISLFSRIAPQAFAERYVDPALALCAGLGLCFGPLPVPFAVLGSFLAVSGVALYGIEKYVHEIQLRQRDALLNAEAHEQVTAAYMQSFSTQESVTLAPDIPLSTGLDATLARNVECRGEKTSAQPPERQPEITEPGPAESEGFVPQIDRLFADHSPGAPVELFPPSTARRPVDGAQAVTPKSAVSPRDPLVVGGAVLSSVVVLGLLILYNPPKLWQPLPAGKPALGAVSSASLPPPKFPVEPSLPPPVIPAVPNAPVQPGHVYPAIPDGDDALTRQGIDFHNGTNGLWVDKTAAANRFADAARNGHPLAQLWLGAMIEQGEAGLKKDLANAAALYHAAAVQDIGVAQRLLGDMYFDGYGIARDLTAALYWYERASMNHEEMGKTKLRDLYQAALAGDKDAQEAYRRNGYDWDAQEKQARAGQRP